MSQQGESSKLLERILAKLESRKIILPGTGAEIARSLEGRVSQDGRQIGVGGPGGVLASVITYLRGYGSRYLEDRSYLDNLSQGEAARFVIDALPVRSGRAEQFYAELAPRIAGSELELAARTAEETLYRRDHRDYHASPPPLSAVERRARQALEALSPGLPCSTLDDLAQRWSGHAFEMKSDRQLIQAFATRLHREGFVDEMPDVYEIAERFAERNRPTEADLAATSPGYTF